jgi:translocator protein
VTGMNPVAAWALSIVAVSTTLVVAGLGTRPQTQWYLDLVKPSWQPSPSVIGLAWTIIYPLIVVVSALVLMSASAGQQRFWIIALVINLVLNALWSWLFFTFELPLIAAVEMSLLLLSILALLVIGTRITPTALFLIPYFAWVSVALAVNVAIVRLN